MIKHLAVVYFRYLFKHKAISFISLFGLAIGIASTLSLVSYSNYELSYDDYQPKGKTIYRLNFGYKKNDNDKPNIAITSAALKPVITSKADSLVRSITLIQRPTSSVSIKINNKKALGINVQAAEGNISDFFPVKEIIGDLSKLDTPGYVFLSESTAMKLFGELPELGMLVEIDFGREVETLQVGGVFTDMPKNSHLDLDVVYSILTLKSKWPNAFESLYKSNNFFQYLTFENDKYVNDLLEILVQHYKTSNPNSENEIVYQLQDIRNIYLNPMELGEVGKTSDRKNVYITLMLALLISLATSFNYTSLVNARASLRSSEFGIKKTIGIQSSAYFIQIIVETIITMIIGTLIALLILYVSIPLLNIHLGIDLNLMVEFKTSLWVLFGFTVLVLINCAAPLIQTSKVSISNLLNGRLLYGEYAARFRSIMIFLQMSFSIFVLVMLAILASQIHFIQNKELGIDRDGLFISSSLPKASVIKNLDVIKSILTKNNESIQVTTSEVAPLGSHNMMASKVTLNGNESKVIDLAPLIGVNYNFVETLGMKLIAGSDFHDEIKSDYWKFGLQDSRSTVGVIVNQGFLDKLSMSNPNELIGKYLNYNWLNYPVRSKVVGIVENSDYLDSQKESEPILFALGFFYEGEQSIIVNSMDNDAKAIIKETISQQTLLSDLKVFAFRDLIEQEYSDAREQLSFLLFFSIVLLIILYLGVLGLTLFTADRKKKEIAIRKVIGAKLSNIVWILLSKFIVIVIAASLFVVPFSYAISDYFLNTFDEKPPFPIFLTVSSIAFILILCVFTVLLVGVKSYNNNVNKILKEE